MSDSELQTHRKLQQEMRKLVDKVIYPDAQLHEEDGKRPTQAVFDEMACVLSGLVRDCLAHIIDLGGWKCMPCDWVLVNT